MQHKEIIIDNSKLAYRVWGETSELTYLAFHGFGQNLMAFEALAKATSNKQFISVDLFYHGKSIWGKDKYITSNNWKPFIDRLIIENNVKSIAIIGFSLGARLAVATTVLYPNRVKELCLIAPDGIIQSPWFKLATSTVLMRGVFRLLMKHPWPLFGMVSILLQIRLIHPNLAKFTESQLNNVETRQQLYLAWVGFRKIKFSPKQIKTIVATQNIFLKLIISKNDMVVPYNEMNEAFINSPNCIIKKSYFKHHQLLTHVDWILGTK